MNGSNVAIEKPVTDTVFPSRSDATRQMVDNYLERDLPHRSQHTQVWCIVSHMIDGYLRVDGSELLIETESTESAV